MVKVSTAVVEDTVTDWDVFKFLCFDMINFFLALGEVRCPIVTAILNW